MYRDRDNEAEKRILPKRIVSINREVLRELMTDLCLDSPCGEYDCFGCPYAEDNDYPGSLINFVNRLVEDGYMNKELALQFMLANK